MDSDTQKKILIAIRDNGGQISVGYLGAQMQSKVLEKTKTGVDAASHNFQLLLDMKKIEYANLAQTSVRLTPLGWQEFDAWHWKIWNALKGDVRTVIVSGITALLTTGITIWITNQYGN